MSKRFDLDALQKTEYLRCENCRLAISETHYLLNNHEWQQLNQTWHKDNNLRQDDPYNRNLRYLNQGLMLHLMVQHGILENSCDWIDWGGGEGLLARSLDENFNLKCSTYDKYIEPKFNRIESHQLKKRSREFVLCTAVFEHIRERATLDEIESLVSHSGCFAVHTLVRGEIPDDPNWMYLLPVHCTFFTNTSMSILMEQWGYRCSVYNENSKLWVWFRSDVEETRTRVLDLNQKIGFEYLKFSSGFMDYWP